MATVWREWAPQSLRKHLTGRVVANLTGKPLAERELFGANMALLSQEPNLSRNTVSILPTQHCLDQV